MLLMCLYFSVIYNTFFSVCVLYEMKYKFLVQKEIFEYLREVSLISCLVPCTCLVKRNNYTFFFLQHKTLYTYIVHFIRYKEKKNILSKECIIYILHSSELITLFMFGLQIFSFLQTIIG